ncbi:MAG TPA: hypothetical protein VKK61_03755 [Tepidisphaeraceae bacterium]|nr:hypothetical protein [Tepidisphaeraceae bacterium]
MSNSRLLGVIIAMQSVLLAGQWLGGPSYLSSAHAQALDAGRDRQQLIDEMHNANAKLDKMIDILSSGDLQVRVIVPDETKGKTSAR